MSKKKGVLFLVLAMIVASFGTAGAAGAPVPTYNGDPGFIASNPGDFNAAKNSWETLEYGTFTGTVDGGPGAITQAWQLHAVNASTAYALGYFGQGVTLGMMDSSYRASHEGFDSDLIRSVYATGVYGTSGYGYRSANPSNQFAKGEQFSVRANYLVGDPESSDWSHGNGMLGVSSGLRDNKGGTHGISFGSVIYSAYTGGSDSQSHGGFHDYNYWYTANKALVDAGVELINSSWGSYVQTLDRRYFNGLGQDTRIVGGSPSAYELTGRDGTGMQVVLPNETLGDIEYQYFFGKKTYSEGGIQYDPNSAGRSFMDAIWDAIKGTTVVNVRSAGNNDWTNPFYRPSYPLFNPWAENQWVAVGGVQPPNANTNYAEYMKTFTFNEAGLAKWWTVSTPSNSTMTTNSRADDAYGNSSGTSPATPVASAVMGVLLSRYPDMNAMQVRELMFTTANNKMTDGVTFLGTGQTAGNGESIAWTAEDGLPDDRWGWGIPDLDKGMYGPGQFLSPMVYNMSQATMDVWSNDISQKAIKVREQEDLKWLADYRAQGIALAGAFSPNVLNEDGTLRADAFMTQGILNDPLIYELTGGHPEMYDKIKYEDAVAWRKAWMDDKAAYIQHKIDNGMYTASLTKQGNGTLVMTGNNTYEGGTTVEGGTLYGFTESFGTGLVNVKAGGFGVLENYNDLFTMKGNLTSTGARLANITINNGATYYIMGENDVNVGTLTFNPGSIIQIAVPGTDILRDIYEDHTITTTGTVTTTQLVGAENMIVDPDWALFDMDVTVQAGQGGASVITGTLSWNNDANSLANFASDSNGRAVANVISTNVPNAIMDDLLWATKDQARNTLDSIGNDISLTADNASIANSLTISRTIIDQAVGYGAGKTMQINERASIWATATGNWTSADFGRTDLDAEMYAGFVGIEAQANPNNKFGFFAGAGTTDFDGGRNGEIESDDLHLGIYGVSNLSDTVQLIYGGMYTSQDRELRRNLTILDYTQKNSVEPNTDIAQIFLEGAYTQFNTESFSIEPYVGLNLMMLKSDGFRERVGSYEFTTEDNDQTIGSGTIGLRGKVPFAVSDSFSLALRGDVSGTAFVGDTQSEANIWISDIGNAKIKGGDMNNPMLNLGLGLDAGIGESVNLGISYQGSFSGDISSNGFVANIRINF